MYIGRIEYSIDSYGHQMLQFMLHLLMRLLFNRESFVCEFGCLTKVAVTVKASEKDAALPTTVGNSG